MDEKEEQDRISRVVLTVFRVCSLSRRSLYLKKSYSFRRILNFDFLSETNKLNKSNLSTFAVYSAKNLNVFFSQLFQFKF